MENVTNVSVTRLSESKYVKPLRLYYTQDGKEKNWDVMSAHNCVAVIIFNLTTKKLVFVKQFRPVAYFNSIDMKDRDNIDTDKYPPKLGVTLELCAGLVDKDKPLEEIAAEEVFEECGYKVDPSSLERVLSFKGDVGVQGSVTTLYYCEVTENMKVSPGGGVDNELIEVVDMSIEDMEKLMTSPIQDPSPSPPAFFFALTWFLHMKASKYR